MSEQHSSIDRSTGPLLHQTWEALQALDPARFDEEKVATVRQTLERVRAELQAQRDAPSPLSDALEELEHALEELPATEDPETWDTFRTTLEPRYERVAQHLAELDVPVPRLRPTNYTRSLVHAGSALAVLVFLELADTRLVRWTASCAFVFAIFLETTRRLSGRWNDVLMKVLGPIAHPAERYRINSASNYILALFVLAWLGYPAIGALAVVVLGFADPVASFVGRRWGRTPLMNGRTLQGSLAFAVTGFGVGALTLLSLHPEIPEASALVMAAVGAVAGALAELASGRIDDNLTIPVITAGAAWAAAAALQAPLVGFG